MAVVVMVALLVVLHALQCASGSDGPRSVAAYPAAAATQAIAHADDTAVALVDAAAVPASVLVHGHHGPMDGTDIAVSACLIMLVAVGVIVLGALWRRIDRGATGRKQTGRLRGRFVGGFALTLLCVLRT
ncbi:hypothetical protein [Micromonospora sp. WMMC250]|uniref:hypothetical protein n=1 Tax=Micromonospora sp. WMMC250 TaxID=3014781 RepID=UPI0022B663E8|nr:hypothetical protein [Micromonospora sp. WMMC250]MCZ7379797.1 hypothetical protein [Micromonospora sp. WMMC250]